MEKKTIIIITSWYPNKENKSGIFVKDQVHALMNSNEIILLHTELNSEKDYISWKNEGEISTIRLFYTEKPLHLTFITQIIRIIFVMKKIIKTTGKPDIIHAHVFDAGFIAVILGKIFRIPVVITEHYSGFYFDKLKKIEKKIAQFAFNNADYIITVSNSLWLDLEKLGVRNKHKVIPNTVNFEKLNKEDFKNTNRSKKKNIVSIGVLVPHKGYIYLLEAVRILIKLRKDFMMNIIGSGPDEEKLEEIIKNNKLNDFVQLLGNVSEVEKIKTLNKSNFLVVSSLYETFGVVIIEAMAVGKPVVSTDCGGPREIINKSNGLLVSIKNSKKLAEGINFMLDNYQKYSEEELQNYVKNKYSYDAIGNQINSLYNEILGK